MPRDRTFELPSLRGGYDTSQNEYKSWEDATPAGLDLSQPQGLSLGQQPGLSPAEYNQAYASPEFENKYPAPAPTWSSGHIMTPDFQAQINQGTVPDGAGQMPAGEVSPWQQGPSAPGESVRERFAETPARVPTAADMMNAGSDDIKARLAAGPTAASPAVPKALPPGEAVPNLGNPAEMTTGQRALWALAAGLEGFSAGMQHRPATIIPSMMEAQQRNALEQKHLQQRQQQHDEDRGLRLMGTLKQYQDVTAGMDPAQIEQTRRTLAPIMDKSVPGSSAILSSVARNPEGMRAFLDMYGTSPALRATVLQSKDPYKFIEEHSKLFQEDAARNGAALADKLHSQIMASANGPEVVKQMKAEGMGETEFRNRVRAQMQASGHSQGEINAVQAHLRTQEGRDSMASDYGVKLDSAKERSAQLATAKAEEESKNLPGRIQTEDEQRAATLQGTKTENEIKAAQAKFALPKNELEIKNNQAELAKKQQELEQSAPGGVKYRNLESEITARKEAVVKGQVLDKFLKGEKLTDAEEFTLNNVVTSKETRDQALQNAKDRIELMGEAERIKVMGGLLEHTDDAGKAALLGAIAKSQGITLEKAADKSLWNPLTWFNSSKASVKPEGIGPAPRRQLAPATAVTPGAMARPAQPQPATAPVRITGDADYHKLKPGALYVGPDGITRTK